MSRSRNQKSLSVLLLEDRCVPAVTASVDLVGDRILRVTGDDETDHIFVERRGGSLKIVAPLSPGPIPIVTSLGPVAEINATSLRGVVIDGGAGSDELSLYTIASGTPTVVSALPWPVTILGGAGDDRINNGFGGHFESTRFFVSGGDGNDVVDGNEGDDTLSGDGGNDTIDGWTGNDLISGGDGNDKLRGSIGNDVLNGGNGNDRLGADPAVSSTEEGHDTLYGEDGADWVGGGAGNDYAQGGFGNDSLWGGDGMDILGGGDGNDQVGATWIANRWIDDAGGDELDGGVGNDSLGGGTGPDILSGRQGNDDLWGDADNDTLRGWEGNDTLHGGAGNDRLGADPESGSFNTPESGNDQLWGDAGDDWAGGGTDTDYVEGGTGNDSVWGGDGNDGVYGGVGNDQVGALWVGNRWIDDAGNDLMTGWTGNDNLGGGTGNDTLKGEQNSDTIWGDGGDDQLWGGTEVDYLYGGSGGDWMDAGAAYEVAQGGGDLYDFNAYRFVAGNGTSAGDVRGGPTWVTAGLAAAAANGVNLSDFINYRGDGVYRVTWKPGMIDGRGQNFEDVTFTGKGSLFGADAKPVDAGESWVILYQRAVLKQAGRAWDNPGSGGCYHEPPLYTGRAYEAVTAGDLVEILDALDKSKLVMACIPAGNATAQSLGLPTGQWYAVLDIRIERQANGVWATLVELYDPHGDTRKITYSQFERCFSSVSIV